MREQDGMISELKMMEAERVKRLGRSLDEQAHELQQQNSSLQQHYTHIISELSTRNEVILFVIMAAHLDP